MLDFNAIVAFCSSEQTLRGGLIGGLFLAGVAGSVMHCAPMCGGFVLGQVADRIAAVPAARLCEWRRVGNALLVPYHLGRLTTYAALGAVAGRIVWLSPVFLVAAVALFGLVALRRVTWLDRTPRPWGG